MDNVCLALGNFSKTIVSGIVIFEGYVNIDGGSVNIPEVQNGLLKLKCFLEFSN